MPALLTNVLPMTPERLRPDSDDRWVWGEESPLYSRETQARRNKETARGSFQELVRVESSIQGTHRSFPHRERILNLVAEIKELLMNPDAAPEPGKKKTK